MQPETYDSVWPKPGETTARKPVRHLGSMPRLPQRGRHRPAIRHDAARPGRKADQHLALRHVARLADGACRARSDLLRPARERDRHIPSGAGEQDDDRGHVPWLPRHHGPAPARDRHQGEDRHLRAVLARRPSNAIPYPAGQPGRSGERRWRTTARSRATASRARRAITWCSARTTPRSITRSRRTCASTRSRRRSTRTSPASPRRSPAPSWSAPPNELYGPFKEPKKKPMKHALGIDPVHSADDHDAGNVRQLPHRASADPASRQDDRARLRADHLSGMGVQRFPHRRFARRPAALRLRPAGAVLPGLPHAEQGRVRQSVPQQDRGDPGIHQLPAGRAHAAGRPTSTCRSAPASASTRWSGSTSTCSRWRGSSPTSSASARPIRCCRTSGIDSIPTAENAMLDQAVNRTAVVTVGEVRNEGDALVGARHRDQQGRAQIPLRRRLPPRVPAVQRARREQQGAVVVRPHQRRGRDRRRRGDANGDASRSRASCGGRTDCTAALRAREAHPPAALSGDHAPGPGADLSGAGLHPGRTSTKPTCGPSAKPEGQLTTSFLSICAKVKDNRILPQGFLKLDERKQISKALGADDKMAEEAGPGEDVANDPDYQRGGSDSLVYRVPLNDINGKAGRRAGDALLPADAAVLSAGPLLHVEQRRHQAAVLRGRQARPHRHTGAELEAAVVTSGPVTVP